MNFPICIYDRTGTGLRLPSEWWIDLPRSSKDERPLLDPQVLSDLSRRIRGSQWLD